MSLQLSGNEERGRNQYQPFEGRVVETMQTLIAEGYEPASVATIFDRRMSAPEEVREAWQLSWFWTGDTASTDETGVAVLTLDTPQLRTLTPESPLYQGAMQLTADQWSDIKANDSSLELSAAEVEEAYGHGLRKQGELWLPVNAAVGKALGHYLRGQSFEDKDFQRYAQMVSEATGGNEEILQQYFDRSKPETPHLRSVVVYSTIDNTNVYGYGLLYNFIGRLVGVAPEALVAREKPAVSTSTNLEGTLQTVDIGAVLEGASRLDAYAPDQVKLLRTLLKEGGYSVVKG